VTFVANRTERFSARSVSFYHIARGGLMPYQLGSDKSAQVRDYRRGDSVRSAAMQRVSSPAVPDS
jgi:hypothetical protein